MSRLQGFGEELLSLTPLLRNNKINVQDVRGVTYCSHFSPKKGAKCFLTTFFVHSGRLFPGKTQVKQSFDSARLAPAFFHHDNIYPELRTAGGREGPLGRIIFRSRQATTLKLHLPPFVMPPQALHQNDV